MFGLPSSTFYHPSFMYLPSQEMSKTHLLTSTPDGKRKQSSDKCQLITKKFCSTISDRPVKKCSFSIDSLLENKTPNLQISNRSYNEDTEDGSSDDGHISFRSPPISSYALFNQIKTLDMSTTTKIKADLTASSGSESDHSPYRLNPNKHLNNNRHGINHKTKPKRIRTIFTPEQLERLESEFDKQQYMVGNERFYLATTLDLTEAQVKVWFQNRRIKWRRQALDDHQQRITSLSGTITSTQAPPSTINDDDDDDPHSDSDE